MKKRPRYVVHVGIGVYYSGFSLKDAEKSFEKWCKEKPESWIYIERSEILKEVRNPGPIKRIKLSARAVSA